MDNQNLITEQMYKIFAGKLLKEKGLGNIPEDVIEEMKEDLSKRIENRINSFILNELPEDKLIEFESLLDNENSTPDQFNNFLHKNISNFAEKMASELLKFREIYLKG